MSTEHSPILKACTVLGGQAELARLLGVTPGAINQWCNGRREVPAERCPSIERLTREKGAVVLCEQLRPDIEWAVLREQA